MEELIAIARRMGISHYELLSQLLYVYLKSSSLVEDPVAVALEASILSYLKKYGMVLIPISVLGNGFTSTGREAFERLRLIARISTLALVEQGVVNNESILRSIFSSWLPGIPLNLVKEAGEDDAWRVVIASPEFTGSASKVAEEIVTGIVEGLGGEIVEKKNGEGVITVRFRLPKRLFPKD